MSDCPFLCGVIVGCGQHITGIKSSPPMQIEQTNYHIVSCMYIRFLSNKDLTLYMQSGIYKSNIRCD